MSDETQNGSVSESQNEVAAKVNALARSMRRRRVLRVVGFVVVPALLVSVLFLYRTFLKPLLERRAHHARVTRQIPVFEAQLAELRRCLGGGGDESGDFPLQVVRHVLAKGSPMQANSLSPCLDAYRQSLTSWRDDRPRFARNDFPELDVFLLRDMDAYAEWERKNHRRHKDGWPGLLQ